MRCGGGKVQLKCGDSRKLLWGAPLSEGRALIAYLIGRGLLLPLGGLVIFLLLVAAKS